MAGAVTPHPRSSLSTRHGLTLTRDDLRRSHHKLRLLRVIHRHHPTRSGLRKKSGSTFLEVLLMLVAYAGRCGDQFSTANNDLPVMAHPLVACEATATSKRREAVARVTYQSSCLCGSFEPRGPERFDGSGDADGSYSRALRHRLWSNFDG